MLDEEPGDSDLALIEAAKVVVSRQYVRGRNSVGAALRTASGQTYAAIHLDADVGRVAVCAEAVALGMAVSAGDREVGAIVAVTPDGDGWAVLPPCGMCREMLSDYAPDATVILGGRRRTHPQAWRARLQRRHEAGGVNFWTIQPNDTQGIQHIYGAA